MFPHSLFFHVPAAFTAFLCFFAAAPFSGITYLKTQNLKWDAFSVSVTEVGLAFGAANFICRDDLGAHHLGHVGGPGTGGLPRCSSAWLLYAGYLVLRRAVEEPTERAPTLGGDVHPELHRRPVRLLLNQMVPYAAPQPVLYGQGKMDAGYRAMLYGNWVPLLIASPSS